MIIRCFQLSHIKIGCACKNTLSYAKAYKNSQTKIKRKILRWNILHLGIFFARRFFAKENSSLKLIFSERAPMENKQEIPCTTEARSTFLGCTGSNLRFLSFFIISMKFPFDRVPSCLLFEIWDFGRIRE
jgi:hypothetical protein